MTLIEDRIETTPQPIAWPVRNGKTAYDTKTVVAEVSKFLRDHRYRYSSNELAEVLSVPLQAISRSMREALDKWPIDERTYNIYRDNDRGVAWYYWSEEYRTTRPIPLRAPVKRTGARSKNKDAVKETVKKDKLPTLGRNIEPVPTAEKYAKMIYEDATMVVLIDQAGRLIQGQYVSALLA